MRASANRDDAHVEARETIVSSSRVLIAMFCGIDHIIPVAHRASR